jgi:hypothetical protein
VAPLAPFEAEDTPIRQTRVTCDRCQQPITEGGTVLSFEAGRSRDQAPARQLDLCETCARMLLAWLSQRKDQP